MHSRQQQSCPAAHPAPPCCCRVHSLPVHRHALQPLHDSIVYASCLCQLFMPASMFPWLEPLCSGYSPLVYCCCSAFPAGLFPCNSTCKQREQAVASIHNIQVKWITTEQAVGWSAGQGKLKIRLGALSNRGLDHSARCSTPRMGKSLQEHMRGVHSYNQGKAGSRAWFEDNRQSSESAVVQRRRHVPGASSRALQSRAHAPAFSSGVSAAARGQGRVCCCCWQAPQ